MSVSYLCCSEEDLLRDVSDGAGDDTQAHTGEDVGVVPLTRVEGPPVGQRDGAERAAAGEDAPALQRSEAQRQVLSSQKESFPGSCWLRLCGDGTSVSV